MPDRKTLVCMLWLTSSLALLTSILVAPVRSSGVVSISSRPHAVRRTCAIPPGQPAARVRKANANDTVLEITALPFENEERDPGDALDESRVSSLIPCTFRKVPDRPVIVSGSILSLYPLRC